MIAPLLMAPLPGRNAGRLGFSFKCGMALRAGHAVSDAAGRESSLDMNKLLIVLFPALLLLQSLSRLFFPSTVETSLASGGDSGEKGSLPHPDRN